MDVNFREVQDGKPMVVKSFNKLLLTHNLALGDLIVFSAIVRDIKLAYPELSLSVKTWTNEIWENNPYIDELKVEKTDKIKVLDCHYPSINQADQSGLHFIEGFSNDVMNDLGIKWPITRIAGDLHLSKKEKEIHLIQEPYWLLSVPGGKDDHTCKWWNPFYVQKIVDSLPHKKFVRVGQFGHFHPLVDGTESWIGKTNIRKLFQLVYYCEGVISSVSSLMHIAAAFDKPAVIISGGREPRSFTQYPNHIHFNNVGEYDCCKFGGCWKSRCQWMDDENRSNNFRCSKPVKLAIPFRYGSKVYPDLSIPKCMNDITPEMVIEAIQSFK